MCLTLHASQDVCPVSGGRVASGLRVDRGLLRAASRCRQPEWAQAAGPCSSGNGFRSRKLGKPRINSSMPKFSFTKIMEMGAGTINTLELFLKKFISKGREGFS